MITRLAGEAGADDLGLLNRNPAADKGFVEAAHRQPGREAAKVGDGAGHLAKALRRQGIGGECVPPIVEVTNDHSRQRFR